MNFGVDARTDLYSIGDFTASRLLKLFATHVADVTSDNSHLMPLGNNMLGKLEVTSSTRSVSRLIRLMNKQDLHCYLACLLIIACSRSD